MKKRSIIGSAVRATGRFTRGIVAVGTVGVSELAIAGVKKVAGLFKAKDTCDEFDFEDDFEDDFTEEDVATEDFREVEEPTPTAAQMAEVAENWEKAAETAPAPTTPAPQEAAVEVDPQ